MYAMGRLGSYISRGVYTVSAPFHPFGGAVDIIVVEQPDGSFKSSPWYVRFGKFQGVLKSKEKIVRICINHADANFHMYLDHKGEAHFLKEVVFEDEESVVYPSSSSDETEEQSNSKRRQLKSISCNYDAGKLNSADPIDTITSGKIVTRTGSNRERILGLVFGRRSMKEDSGKEEEVGPGLTRTSSLERAELAADLLDVKWSTNLASSRSKKDNTSKLSVCGIRGDRQSYGENGFSNNQTATVSSIKEVKTSMSGATDYPEKQFDIEEVANKRDVLQDCGIATYCETSPISVLDVSCEEIHERLSISSGGHEEVHIHAETMLRTIEPSAEDMVVKQAEEMELDVEETSKIPESYTRTVSVGQMLGSVKEVKPSCTSSSSDSITQIRVENENDLLPPLRSVSDPQKICGGSEITKSFSTSEASEEEQFLFSDLDEFKQKEQLCIYGECQSSIGTNGEEGNNSSLDKCVQENVSDDVESSVEKPEVTSDPISIQRSSVFGEKDCWQLGSLPNLWSPDDKLYRPNTCFLSHSLDSKSETLKRISLGVDDSSCMKAGAIEELQSAKGRTNLDDADASVVIPVEESFAGDQSKSISSSSGNWKLWPFSYRKSNSSKQIAQRGARIPTSNDVVKGPVGCPEGEKDDQGKQLAQVDANISENEKADNIEKVRKTEKVKKMAKVMIPTSEQLASLNLKEGNNSVTFTFSTAMLGDQQVHARIFLWKWNTRIVISDVDGTITKSDVLGQFMPLVGRDWSQTGVAHLFSAIKENGYELLFLSARSITQAYHTRRFIVNLKQDGKALPDGPVVISPDGLFPSLYREVIRRAPHEFKIGCLEDIKALFPPDTNPFYAGFGNRDTDEFSYLKVGIPKGKIFIINPKGEVAVHRRIDTKSYTSLHALVHGMFPIRPSSEQEDFNSWNFWKLPPPEIK